MQAIVTPSVAVTHLEEVCDGLSDVLEGVRAVFILRRTAAQHLAPGGKHRQYHRYITNRLIHLVHFDILKIIIRLLNHEILCAKVIGVAIIT